jgi:hypothetical protein
MRVQQTKRSSSILFFTKLAGTRKLQQQIEDGSQKLTLEELIPV